MNPSEKSRQTRTAGQINAKVDKIVKRQVTDMDKNKETFTASMLTALTQRYGKGDMTEEAKKDLMEQLQLVRDPNTAA
tara:strand:+ start:240 stop:473 length:234 start_codon:yes stop_codon:yes gene_type:complete